MISSNCTLRPHTVRKITTNDPKAKGTEAKLAILIAINDKAIEIPPPITRTDTKIKKASSTEINLVAFIM